MPNNSNQNEAEKAIQAIYLVASITAFKVTEAFMNSITEAIDNELLMDAAVDEANHIINPTNKR